jgi:hypothetical protein
MTTTFAPRSLTLRLLAGLLLCGGVASVPAPAHAMTVLQVDLKTMVGVADLVLQGTIAATKVLDRRAEGRGVWTEYTLDVAEVWKGDARLAGKPFAWRHIGGTTADGRTVSVPGMPTFRPGEEVVVILEKTSQGHVVSGGPQGKFAVFKDASGKKIVTRDLSEAHLVRHDPATGRVVEGDKAAAITRPLAEMRAEVLAYVAAKPVASPSAPSKSPIGK